MTERGIMERRILKNIAILDDETMTPVIEIRALIHRNASLVEMMPYDTYLEWAAKRKQGTLGTFPRNEK